VNDNLKPDEIEDLEQVAEWLDSLYVRLQGAEIVFATQNGNDRYCELLQGEIERATQIGIALNRPMENCGCLFEALNGGCDPKEFLIRARAEVNAIAVAVRQMAIAEHRDAKKQTEDSKFKYPALRDMYIQAKANTKLSEGEKTYQKVAELYWKTLDTKKRPSVYTLRRWLERPKNH
jgi:hypothetical protein